MNKNITKLMKTASFIFLSILVLVTAFGISGVSKLSGENADNKGREIMLKVENQPQPNSQIMSQYMLIKKGNNTYKKTYDVYSKEFSDNLSKSLVKFNYPSKVKFLTWSYKDKQDDIWIKMDSGAPRKVVGSEREEGDYMGSHFSYSDMEEYDFDEFTYTYKTEGKIDGELTYLIEMKKKDGDWPYSKQRAYVRAKDYQITNIEFYNKAGEKTKKLEMLYTKVKGYNIPKIMKMELIDEKDQWTVLGVDKDSDGDLKVEVDVSDDRLPESTFNKDTL